MLFTSLTTNNLCKILLLKRKVIAENYGINIKEFDLYEIVLTILEGKGYLDKVFEMEKEKGTDKILTPIKRTLRLTQKDDLVVHYIKQKS